MSNDLKKTQTPEEPLKTAHKWVRTLDHMTVPPSLNDPQTYQKFGLYQFIYSMFGLVLGLICMLGGIVLFLRGVAGSTSWTAKFIGIESHLSDSPPGVMLFVVGLFVVWVTRFTIKAQK